MSNIVLIGFMGTGKSTIGRLLSKKLDFQFVDTDELISQREGACIPDIFLKQGEEYFRDLESLIIERLMKEDKLVVSTGGGAVLRAKNLRLLKENGIVISLMASIETLIRRMDSFEDRPLLNSNNPHRRLSNLYNQRRPIYQKADFSVDVDDKTPDEVVDLILKTLSIQHTKQEES